MPKPLKVVPADLHHSAITVDFHADDVCSKHSAADGRIEVAQPGLPAGAAAALSGAVEKWQADTSAIYGRMVDHSNGLRSGAATYHSTDQEGSKYITDAADEMPVIDMGL